jgi:hypothetical protein
MVEHIKKSKYFYFSPHQKTEAKAPCLDNKKFDKLKKFEKHKAIFYLPLQEVGFLLDTSSIDKERHDQLNLTHYPYGRHFEKERQDELGSRMRRR